MLRLDDLAVAAPAAGPHDWNDDGVVIVDDLIDRAVLDAYVAAWEREFAFELHSTSTVNGRRCFDADAGHGWPHATPYVHCRELLDVVCDPNLADLLADLIGEPAAVNLTLTGWRSTERNWHQDAYLNPPQVGDAYAAVWIALDDIDPDSGPFQYVAGSHRWPQITRDIIGQHVDLTDPRWPKHSEQLLVPIFDAEIAARDATVTSWVPSAGSVLVWHGRLLHRGSRPRQPGLERRGLIAHFSGIAHRPDMPDARKHPSGGGWFFPIDTRTPVR